MELKDVILSTLAEIEEDIDDMPIEQEKSSDESEQDGVEEKAETTPTKRADSLSDEIYFLEHLRERILVLFEGFQSPHNKDIEAKIDLTLNFLEYLLATLDERLEVLKKS
jgi:hypothetical protein